MAQEDRNLLVEWYELLRKQLPILRKYGKEWFEAVREEPVLLWETPAVRYSVYGFGAIIVLWGASTAASMLVPPPPKSAGPIATTADFHVVCTGTNCTHHFVLHREFGFRGFPAACTRCGRDTALQARRCNSDTCLGRWVAPRRDADRSSCPRCNHRFE